MDENLRLRFERLRPLLPDYDAFLDAATRRGPKVFWLHPERAHRAPWLSGLVPDARALPWRSGAYRTAWTTRLGGTWAWQAGLLHVQEEASMLPVRALAPQPGERILDLCAAPGGKAAELALAVGPSGLVVANEPRVARHRPLRQAIERLGLWNLIATRKDGTAFPDDFGAFDAVLVDAPCSCEGTTRKSDRPFARGLDRHHHEHAALQRRLLARALELCRVGGRVIYSTCTYAPEENEAVVDALIRSSEGKVRVAPMDLGGFPARPGLLAFGALRFDASLEGAARIWPQDADTGGFFVAKLEKLAGTEPGPRRVSSAPVLPRAAWVHEFQDQHGIEDAALEPLEAVHESGKGLYLGARTLLGIQSAVIETKGIRALGTKRTPAKLTTAAALALAPMATHGVIDVDVSEREAYRRHELFIPKALIPPRDAAYVLVRHEGKGLGTAVWHERSGQIESLFPKGWGTDTHKSEPDEG